eukprot:GHVO01020098.1.p1 GENE.GHVO01020098.1~~GHVO01020098.1.p1  ORF type:complete len:333 (-),score=71.13 GHVO01020098.1:136-1134(-)
MTNSLSFNLFERFPWYQRRVRVMAIGTIEWGWNTEAYHIFVFCRSIDREDVIQAIYGLSGMNTNTRVNIHNDVVHKEIFRDPAPPMPQTKVLYASYVFTDNTHRNSVLHILTADEIIEFRTHWPEWTCPKPDAVDRSALWDTVSYTPDPIRLPRQNDDDASGSGSDENDENQILGAPDAPLGLENFLGYTMDAVAVAELRNKILGQVADEQCKTEFKRVLRNLKSNLLIITERWSIESILRLSFGKEEIPYIDFEFTEAVPTKAESSEGTSSSDTDSESSSDSDDDNPPPPKIGTSRRVVYMDDSDRERWKRSLALVLSRLSDNTKWSRKWI